MSWGKETTLQLHKYSTENKMCHTWTGSVLKQNYSRPLRWLCPPPVPPPPLPIWKMQRCASGSAQASGPGRPHWCICVCAVDFLHICKNSERLRTFLIAVFACAGGWGNQCSCGKGFFQDPMPCSTSAPTQGVGREKHNSHLGGSSGRGKFWSVCVSSCSTDVYHLINFCQREVLCQHGHLVNIKEKSLKSNTTTTSKDW